MHIWKQLPAFYLLSASEFYKIYHGSSFYNMQMWLLQCEPSVLKKAVSPRSDMNQQVIFSIKEPIFYQQKKVTICVHVKL